MEQSAAVGVPQEAGAGVLPAPEEPFNQPAIDFLRRLPGVTEANYRRVMVGCARAGGGEGWADMTDDVCVRYKLEVNSYSFI